MHVCMYKLNIRPCIHKAHKCVCKRSKHVLTILYFYFENWTQAPNVQTSTQINIHTYINIYTHSHILSLHVVPKHIPTLLKAYTYPSQSIYLPFSKHIPTLLMCIFHMYTLMKTAKERNLVVCTWHVFLQFTCKKGAYAAYVHRKYFLPYINGKGIWNSAGCRLMFVCMYACMCIICIQCALLSFMRTTRPRVTSSHFASHNDVLFSSTSKYYLWILVRKSWEQNQCNLVQKFEFEVLLCGRKQDSHDANEKMCISHNLIFVHTVIACAWCTHDINFKYLCA